jgi:Ca-activated chloride channel family protein
MRPLAHLVLLVGLAGWHARSPQVFRTSADAVPVYVSVTGPDGIQVKGLEQKDFTLLDNGKPQPITFFSAERHAFALALLLDVRSGMLFGPGWARQMAFGQALAGALDPDDRVALGSTAKPILPLSSDKLEVSRQLGQPPVALVGKLQLQADEPVASQAFVWAGAMLSSYDGRRIAVLFTDASTRISTRNRMFDYADPAQVAGLIVKESERSDVAFQLIGFDDSTMNEEFLRAFSGTGGGASLVTRDADFKAVAREFVDELHNEYFLAFVPTQLDGKSHKLQVKVNRPSVTVRARASYRAPKR